MSKQQEIFALIAKLGGSRNKVIVDRSLCQFMGSLERGVFLSQLLYWSDKGKGGDWFYKTYTEWHEETFLSEYQIRQAAKACVEMGFLETKLAKANGAPTVHYRINSEKFIDSILKFFRMDSEIPQNESLNSEECILEKLQNPYTENTTETTTEITESVADATPAPKKSPTSQQEMFAAVCEAIGWDYHTLSKDDRGKVAQAAGILTKADYGVEDIRRFMVEVWFNDWRWTKHQSYPTLSQLRQEIGKTRSAVPAAAPPKKRKGIDGYREMLAGQGISL